MEGGSIPTLVRGIRLPSFTFDRFAPCAWLLHNGERGPGLAKLSASRPIPGRSPARGATPPYASGVEKERPRPRGLMSNVVHPGRGKIEVVGALPTPTAARAFSMS